MGASRPLLLLLLLILLHVLATDLVTGWNRHEGLERKINPPATLTIVLPRYRPTAPAYSCSFWTHGRYAYRCVLTCNYRRRVYLSHTPYRYEKFRSPTLEPNARRHPLFSKMSMWIGRRIGYDGTLDKSRSNKKKQRKSEIRYLWCRSKIRSVGRRSWKRVVI